MPVMNGYEATKQIRALRDPALAGITILAMTANAFDEDRKKALECGIDVYKRQGRASDDHWNRCRFCKR